MAAVPCLCFDDCGTMSSRPSGGCCPEGVTECLTCGGALTAAAAFMCPNEKTKIYCNLVPEDACDSCVPHCESASCGGRFGRAARTTVVDPTGARYVAACVVYFIYALGVVLIDIYAYGGFVDGGLFGGGVGNSEMTGALLWQPDMYNKFWLALGAIHFINAWQFGWAWYGRLWHEVVLWPEYMNVVGACLYLISASMYPAATAALIPHADLNSPDPANPVMVTDYTSPVVMHVHYVETAAALWEVMASVGWTYTWWLTYTRKPGRGFTLDDTDLLGTIAILVPSLIYLAYNVMLLLDPTTYGSNQLYIVGDYFYFTGSCCYVLSALRDTGWWWWAPHAGRCNPLCPSCPARFGAQPLEVPTGEAEREYWGEIFATWGGGPGPVVLSGAGKEAPASPPGSHRGPSTPGQRVIVAGTPAGGLGSGHRMPRQSSQRSNVLRSAGSSLRGTGSYV